MTRWKKQKDKFQSFSCIFLKKNEIDKPVIYVFQLTKTFHYNENLNDFGTTVINVNIFPVSFESVER
jgi:hypothetical protein